MAHLCHEVPIRRTNADDRRRPYNPHECLSIRAGPAGHRDEPFDRKGKDLERYAGAGDDAASPQDGAPAFRLMQRV
jgi:hypothetical protein